MKMSKIVKFSFITATILTFTACGGGSSSGGETTTPERNNISTINEAKSSFQALSALDSLGGANNSLNNKASNNNNKTSSGNCSSGGTVTITEDGSQSTIVANNCKNDNYYMNGTLSVTQNSDGSEKMIMSNMTVKDGKIEFSSTSLTLLTNDNEHWSKMDGDINIISKCFSGNYDFETVQKIYDAQDGSDNAESGILKLNGVTYTFNNPYVTIKVGDTEETILQSELEKKMKNTTTCSE